MMRSPLDAKLLSKLKQKAIGTVGQKRGDRLYAKFVLNPGARATASMSFVAAETGSLGTVSLPIESKPLTAESASFLCGGMRRDPRTSWCGIGKDLSVKLPPRAAYPGQSRNPETGRKSCCLAICEAMRRVKCQNGLRRDPVSPSWRETFHSAWLMTSIGAVEGSKPALADHRPNDAARSAR